MPLITHSEFHLGDMLVRYQAPADAPDRLGLVIVPLDRVDSIVVPREHIESAAIRVLPKRWQPVQAWDPDSLVHVQLQQQPYPGAYSQGRSLRAGPSTLQFRLVGQKVERTGATTVIISELASPAGLVALHRLSHTEGETALRVVTTVKNAGDAPRTLELLTSFSLSGITPFADDDAPERLWVHRFRSAWSAEARHEELRIEQLHLERSWTGHGVRAERFGQVGSLPTNGFFPFVAIEDREANVCWAAKLAHPGSWQLEIFRKGDQLCLSGGLADREFGHWWKTLAPGEKIESPEAFLTTSSDSFEETCDRLNALQPSNIPAPPAAERELPVIFNEWCTSWGNPTEKNLVTLASHLHDSGVKYLVIDDGWAERPGDGIQQNGDWIVNRSAFPGGLKATANAIRAQGLIPGIWFEFEAVNPGSKAWDQTEHQLHRDGVPLQVGNRRFWDFRDPWVHDYLGERVTGLLRECNFGYLKIDYNDTIGLGCDGADSPGEGLRQHLAGVQKFLRQLREELPELVIENCSSGGHRAEPSMVGLTAMASFSDAHETVDIPIIAANLHRLIPAARSQIWAVFRQGDSRQRLSYSLAAAFLGRMCLSGDIYALSAEDWSFVREGIALYRELAPLIATGRFRRFGEMNHSYQHLKGWQAVIVEAADGNEAYVVWHAFAAPPDAPNIPLPAGKKWRATRELTDQPTRAAVQAGHLIIPKIRPWSGGVIVLK